MPSHADTAKKVLASIKGTRTDSVKATIALTHATLEVAVAIRHTAGVIDKQLQDQEAQIERLWHEPTG